MRATVRRTSGLSARVCQTALCQALSQAGTRSLSTSCRASSASSATSSTSSSTRQRNLRLLCGLSAGVAMLMVQAQRPAKAEDKSAQVVAGEPGIVEKTVNGVKDAFGDFFGLFTSFFKGDQTELLPKELPDMHGLRPRTVVVGIEDTIVFLDWNREDGWKIRKRPGMDVFLNELQRRGFEVVAWTAKPQMEYEPVLADIDGDTGRLAQRLFREHTNWKGLSGVQKDLSRLNRDERRIIVVEREGQIPKEFASNCIKVKPFKDDVNDKELFAVVDFIKDLQKYNVTDVRPYIEKFNAGGKEREDVFKAEKAMRKEVEKDASKPRRSKTAFYEAQQHLRETETA